MHIRHLITSIPVDLPCRLPQPMPMPSSSGPSVSQTGSLYSPGCPGWLQTHKDPPASAFRCWDWRRVPPRLDDEHCKISNFHSILSSRQDVSSQLWMLLQHTRQTRVCLLPLPLSQRNIRFTMVFYTILYRFTVHPETYCVTHLRTLETKEGKVVPSLGHPAKF